MVEGEDGVHGKFVDGDVWNVWDVRDVVGVAVHVSDLLVGGGGIASTGGLSVLGAGLAGITSSSTVELSGLSTLIAGLGMGGFGGGVLGGGVVDFMCHILAAVEVGMLGAVVAGGEVRGGGVLSGGLSCTGVGCGGQGVLYAVDGGVVECVEVKETVAAGLAESGVSGVLGGGSGVVGAVGRTGTGVSTMMEGSCVLVTCCLYIIRGSKFSGMAG